MPHSSALVYSPNFHALNNHGHTSEMSNNITCWIKTYVCSLDWVPYKLLVRMWNVEYEIASPFESS